VARIRRVSVQNACTQLSRMCSALPTILSHSLFHCVNCLLFVNFHKFPITYVPVGLVIVLLIPIVWLHRFLLMQALITFIYRSHFPSGNIICRVQPATLYFITIIYEFCHFPINLCLEFPMCAMSMCLVSLS
jgi:hypothetical protein